MLFVPLRMLCKPAAEVDYDGHGYKPEENTWGIFDGNACQQRHMVSLSYLLNAQPAADILKYSFL